MTTATVTSSHVWGPTHMAMLEFERGRWKNPGARDAAIAERFQLLPTEYNVVLSWVLDQPEAVAYDPQTVDRLRRLRDGRRAARSGARLHTV